MDYIDSALNELYKTIEISEEMNKLEIDDLDEYINYLADEKEHYQLMQAEI